MAAISGIARKIQEQTGDEYIVGLWRKTILSDLVWRKDDEYPSHITSTHSLPSWTWASVDCKVEMWKDMETTVAYIDIRDVQLDFANPEDPFGHVSGGTLTIRSRLMTRLCMGGPEETPLPSVDEYEYFWWDDDEDHECEILLVPILLSSELGEAFYSALLLRDTELGNGQYERVGLYRLYFYGPSSGDSEELDWKRKVERDIGTWFRSEDSVHRLPREGDYKEVERDEDGTIWYTIDIV